ncbi:MAG: hypothetical protein WKH68_12150 [Candidatus Limnocylindria bacterium]
MVMPIYCVIRNIDGAPEVDLFEDRDHAERAARASEGIFQEQAVFPADDPDTETFVRHMEEAQDA